MVTTTVRVDGGALPLLPVVSDRPIAKGSIFACLRLLRSVTVTAPVAADSVVLADALGLGVNFLASRDCAQLRQSAVGRDQPSGAAIGPPTSVSAAERNGRRRVALAAAAAELADNDSAPWHDPSLPISERMAMAEGKPLAMRMMAAMAQQDCRQCGYDCAGYANALVLQEEERLTLCATGGKETARVLRAARRRDRRERGRAGDRRRAGGRAGAGFESRILARRSEGGEVPVASPPQRRQFVEDDLAHRVRYQRQRPRLCRRRQFRRLSQESSRVRRSGDRRARRRSAPRRRRQEPA